MAVSVRKRIPVLAGVILGIALMLPGSPAQAQPFTGGTLANALTGSGIAVVCPPNSAGAQAGGSATVGVASVANAGAQCAPTAANTAGLYGIGAPATLQFHSSCDANNGQTGGFVQVPAGSTVNGVLVNQTTNVTETATVVYPNGTTAIVNQVITTPTSVTRNAVAINGGPIIGQVICGSSAYPLAVDTAAASAAASATEPFTPGGDSGLATSTLVIGGAIAVAVLAQLTIGRKMWRRKGDATG